MIVGVRYIGKKARKEDNVLQTGAVWARGQVLNFEESLADRLLAHADVFEKAQPSDDGKTFTSAAQPPRMVEPVAYVNLTNMGVNELALFARREFGRTVETDGRDVADVRAEVHRMMVSANLDEIAEEIRANGVAEQVVASKEVTQGATQDGLPHDLATKEELLAYAKSKGISGLDGRNSVETIRRAIRDATSIQEV